MESIASSFGPSYISSSTENYVEESLREEETFHFLGFESLHRLNIVRLQNELASLKSKARQTGLSGEDYHELQQTLHAYSTAIKDYAYLKSQKPLDYSEMNARKLRLKRHFPELNQKHGRPFDSHYYFTDHGPPNPDALRSFLRKILPTSLTYSEEERKSRQAEFIAHQPAHGISNTVDRLARLIIAFVGGIFLLVPMIIMVLRTNIIKSIITTSTAVILFATAIAFGIRATNVETMVSTATYAAVLVVFVGSNNNS